MQNVNEPTYQNLLPEFHNKYIKHTPKNAFVEDVTILLCYTTEQVAEIINSKTTKV